MAYQSHKYDVLRFVKRYIKDYHVISNGKEISVNCIWCSPKDYKKKLTVNAKTGLFHCWRCNEKGNFFAFVKAYGKTTEEPHNFLLGTEISGVVRSTEIETQISYPEYFRFLSESSSKSLIACSYFRYLFERGLSLNDIDYYNIGFCNVGKFNKRVIVPVYKDNSLVSYIARTITDIKPKVLTPSSLPGTHGIKDYVFNIDRAKETKVLYIGEGVFDAISLGVSGIALFGKEATRHQLATIINVFPRRVVICLDGDAYKYSVKLAQQLMLHISDIRVAKLPEDKDPSSMDAYILRHCILNAQPFDGSLEI